MAAVLAPLLSIVTLSGRPCCRTAFLKKRRAAFLSRWGGEQEVNGLAVLVDGAVEILPLALNLNVWVSKLKEPPLQLLAELSVILSHHSAPIIQPRAYNRVPSVEKDKAFALQFSPTDASPDDDAP